ncbi:MAG: ABC transporter permease, partial [Oscillospiraceae bacterium]|nr:ABC transporter permease [Oscillospiraceae bacterium]
IILGTAVCIYGIPFCITGAWGIMYELPNTVYKLMPVYIILGALIATGSTVLAAYIACRNELKVVPSVLMRPKPPKAGKRVFLENINFIWKRLSFTSKVTVRNLFRNFNRFAVTVLGIAGCTALILSAFGLRDAIGGVIDNQYAKDIGIARYDLQVVLKDYQNSYNESLIVSDINNIDGIDSSMLVYLKVCEGFSDREDNTLEVDVLVPENPNVFQNFVNLEYKGKDVPLTDEGAVISKKFADKTDTKVGDTVKILWTEGSKVVEYDVLVTVITENYTFHYVYMTPYYFSKLTQSNMGFNYLFCKLTDDVTPEQKVTIESQINQMRGVNGSVFTTVVIDNFNNIVNSLNIVIMLLIVAAMGLAIVVIYNLNNINVNERIRELATLKVLGFYDGEVSAYIYRENIFLTVIGIALGLVLGIPLNIAVIGVVDIDTLTFKTDLEPLSYILAIVITVVFAIIVNFLMHLKLKKISMVESLKSVE